MNIDRRPALIARCTCAADVINAVNFARAQRLLIAVRGGGHNVAGLGTCDEGIVLDLSPMKGIRVEIVRDMIEHRLDDLLAFVEEVRRRL